MTATAVREGPILFSGPMVRAIMEGRKTKTRRIVTDRNSVGNFKASELDLSDAWVDGSDGSGDYPAHQYLHAGLTQSTAVRFGYHPDGDGIVERLYPRYEPGARLWVRETWAPVSAAEEAAHGRGALYRAESMFDGMEPGDFGWKWKPSIHMPRWASRITLEITGVRVERLEEISEADAIAEGCFDEKEHDGLLPTHVFSQLWDDLNAKRGFGWKTNPWVWVVEFKRVAA